MADPVSVAGSAVGVISLAITTCQGVISYYDSWETQDQNISHAKGKIERLRSSLSALEEILPKISSSSAIAEHVERCVLCCREGTARLEQFLGRCRKDPAPLSLRDKLRVFRQKAIFPFRESSLDRLREIVRDLEGDLGTALRVLQLDTSEAQFRRTSDLIDLTKSTAVSVSEADQNISNIEQRVNMVIGALPQLQTGVARFTSDVQMLRSSFKSMEQDMKRRLQAIEGVTSQILPDFQRKLDRLPLQIQGSLAESKALTGLCPSVETSDLKLVNSARSTTLSDMDEDARKLELALAQRPSLLRTVCDEAGGLEMNVERASNIMARNRMTQHRRKGKWTKQRLYCSCSTHVQQRASTYSIGGVQFSKTSMEYCKHSVSCPFYIGTEATTTVGLKMTYYGKLLANTVRATISITTGAGGFSINPCLTLHARVSKFSPAFELLHPKILGRRFMSTRLSQTNELCNYFESALQQLYELFQDKVASPTDVDQDGWTLITTLCRSNDLLKNHSTEAFQSFRVLFMGLVAAGVPLNETDRFGLTALDTLTEASVYGVKDARSAQKYAQLAMGVAGAGAEHSDKWRRNTGVISSPIPNVRELEWMIKYDGWTDGYASARYHCGALIAAIVSRSESDTERILQSSPQSIHEQDLRGQSPLHLSCDWPKGIILLLHYGGREILDRPDNAGFLPLAYSCTSNCLEAVKLMLEADSALFSPHSCPNWSPCFDIFKEAITTNTAEIISHLETALVVRRTRLYTLATSELTQKELEELKVTNDRLLDEKASAHPTISNNFIHSKYLSPALGESLYRHGFVDVDGINSSGRTALMLSGDECFDSLNTALQRASWLISKGANPGRKRDQSVYNNHDPSVTAAHCICSWIGEVVYWQIIVPKWISSEKKRAQLFGTLDKLGDESQSVLGKLIFSKYYDHCFCACSSHGCTPAIMLLKGLMKRIGDRRDKSIGAWRGRSYRIGMCIWMIDFADNLLGHAHEAWQWLSREIIRYVTFEKLGITHTCCNSRFEVFDTWGDKDDKEREKIRDEERLSIDKLDALVIEFEERYAELGVTLPDFLNGYWKTRMEEVERDDEPLDEEQIAKIKDLGVVIHS